MRERRDPTSRGSRRRGTRHEHPWLKELPPAEEIVHSFPTLQLPDVYQVIGYNLKHSAELAEYFERREREEKELLAAHPEWSPKGLRERLMARRKSQ